MLNRLIKSGNLFLRRVALNCVLLFMCSISLIASGQTSGGRSVSGNVTSIASSNGIDSVVSCGSYSWNGQTYSQSGTYTYTSSTASGTDSVLTLVLTVHQPTKAFQAAYACGCYFWNGQNYTQSGSYFFQTINQYGCDSIVLLSLTLGQPTYSTQTAVACDSYFWNGQSYTLSGTYTYETLNNSFCDSVVTLHLTITPSSQSTQVVSAVDSYTWSLDGATYTQSGTYTYTNGCHTELLDLTVIHQATVNVKFFIEGFYEGPDMRPVLLNRGVNSNSNDVDSVQALLADTSNPLNIVAVDTAVLDIHGNAQFGFPGAVIGNRYYLGVQNNNSIRTWSATPVLITQNTTYDFSDAMNKAFADNMVEVAPGVWAIFTGDLNQDGFIDPFDYSVYEADAFNFLSGYYNTDMNGDGFVDTFDYTVYEKNSFLFISVLTP